MLKKQAKRGKSEKQLQELKRVKAVLQLQGLLDSLGSDTVRKDFQSGKHGAIVSLTYMFIYTWYIDYIVSGLIPTVRTSRVANTAPS